MLSEHLLLPSFPDYCQWAISDRIIKKETSEKRKRNIYHNTGAGESFFKENIPIIGKQKLKILKNRLHSNKFYAWSIGLESKSNVRDDNEGLRERYKEQ